MKTTELRIGNYILISMLQEDGGFKNELVIVNSTVIRDAEHYNNEWNADPIPLTKEWLVKLGYHRDEFSFNEEDWQYKYHRISEFTKGVFTCDKTGVNLKHVHELQNLYFALTGEELSIKT